MKEVQQPRYMTAWGVCVGTEPSGRSSLPPGHSYHMTVHHRGTLRVCAWAPATTREHQVYAEGT